MMAIPSVFLLIIVALQSIVGATIVRKNWQRKLLFSFAVMEVFMAILIAFYMAI